MESPKNFLNYNKNTSFILEIKAFFPKYLKFILRYQIALIDEWK